MPNQFHQGYQEPHTAHIRRRGLVTGAAGLLGGWLAARLARPESAQANSGDSLLIGNGNQTDGAGTKTLLAMPQGNTLSPCMLQVDNSSTGPGTPPPSGYRVAIVGTVAGNDTTTNPRVGVYGQADTSSGYGLVGNATGGGVGVSGASTSSYGVLGQSSSNSGVVGASTSQFGVYGISNTNAGVVGQTSAANASGVLGYALVSGANAVTGSAVASGAYAGLFTGPVLVSGNFTVANGTKSAAVKAPDGSYKTLYCMESPESWFEDFGAGQLTAGKATVPIPADLVPFILTTGYHVFVVPEGDCKGLYVTNKTVTSFDVHELQGGTSNAAFSFRLLAKRKDVTALRLAPVTIPAPPPVPTNPALPKLSEVEQRDEQAAHGDDPTAA